MEIAGSSGLFVGGASGMCRATATKFAERGGNVAILDLEQSEGASVAESLGGKFYPCNVMDYDGMEAVMASAIGDLGSLHFMVNTAGAVLHKERSRRMVRATRCPTSGASST